jgi:hypothetical protein
MSTLTVRFRGLFTVVRHTASPGTDNPEKMTIVLPKDHGMGGMGMHAGMHTAKLIVRLRDLMEPYAETLTALNARFTGQLDYLELDITGWTLQLPQAAQQDPVTHDKQQDLMNQEPKDAGDVGPETEKWRSLSRLPNLNGLFAREGRKFSVNLADNADVEAHLQAVVRLSGGELHCVRSPKALADGFFEFFTEDETVVVQPAVEDVEYTTKDHSPQHDVVTLQFDSFLKSKPPQRLTLSVAISKDGMIIDGFPPLDAAKPRNLSHFLNFYPLMGVDPAAETFAGPFLRVLGFRHKMGNRLLHTMPGLKYVPDPSTKGGKAVDDPFAGVRTTAGTCTCLAAQAFDA